MSIALPSILRRDARTPRHKAINEVERLRHQLDGASLLFAGMRLQVAQAEDARDKANAKANLLQEADTRAEAAEARMRAMTDELAELRAFHATATAVTVPPMVRDTSAFEDQATEPFCIKTLQAALGTAVTDPGQTTWGAARQAADNPA